MPKPTYQSAFMSIEEFAATLGISKRTVERWRALGRIRVLSIDSTVRIPRGEIDRLMRGSRAASHTPQPSVV